MNTNHQKQNEHRPEYKSFLTSALCWAGSATPRVLPRVFAAVLYSIFIIWAVKLFPTFSIPISPFEYSGAVLGILLVLRVNSGHERWWEARKHWGSIVNQSRNLALIVSSHYTQFIGAENETLMKEILQWIASFPYVLKESLRKSKNIPEVEKLLGVEEASRITSSEHMPTYTAKRIHSFLECLNRKHPDSLAYLNAQNQLILLIDALGACERIRNTSIPFSLAVKIRRFILLFILLLPIALVHKVGWVTPLIIILTSYPLFSLDEIGAELQNPFSPRNLSNLPLDSICYTIESNVLEVLRNNNLYSPELAEGLVKNLSVENNFDAPRN